MLPTHCKSQENLTEKLFLALYKDTLSRIATIQNLFRTEMPYCKCLRSSLSAQWEVVTNK